MDNGQCTTDNGQRTKRALRRKKAPSYVQHLETRRTSAREVIKDFVGFSQRVEALYKDVKANCNEGGVATCFPFPAAHSMWVSWKAGKSRYQKSMTFIEN